MEAIWKQSLECADRQTVELPIGAKVLCVQTQQEKPCLWFITPQTESPIVEERTFAIRGTGHRHPQIDGRYIGTFQLQAGSLVFHVFEVEGGPARIL